MSVEAVRSVVLADLVSLVLAGAPDELDLAGVRTATLERLRGHWPTHTLQGFASEAPFVDLEAIRDSGSDYLSHLSSNTRGQIRRSHRLYEERLGPARLSVARDDSEAQEWFSELVEIHARRWAREGVSGAFSRSTTLAFHRDLIREAQVGGRCRDRLGVDLLRVEFGDTTVGLLYNLVHQGCVHFYQSALVYHNDDPRLKPGLVSHALAVERSVELGDREYDYLGGSPEPVRYKRSLSTDVRHLYWVQLAAPKLKMRLIGGARALRRRILGIDSGENLAVLHPS